MIADPSTLDGLDAATRKYIDAIVEEKVAESLGTRANNRATLIVFSGDMDKLLSAFSIATGAVSMGMEVTMYFTFWGLGALKKTTLYGGKSLTDKMMAVMLPGTVRSVPTSSMNMLGMGPAFFRKVMKDKNVASLPELISLAQELEVRMIACQMAMDVMGIQKDELIEDIEFGGVATYLGEAADSTITLFV